MKSIIQMLCYLASGNSFMSHGMLDVGASRGGGVGSGGDGHAAMATFGPKVSRIGRVAGGEVAGGGGGMYTGSQDTQHSDSTSPFSPSLSAEDFRRYRIKKTVY